MNGKRLFKTVSAVVILTMIIVTLAACAPQQKEPAAAAPTEAPAEVAAPTQAAAAPEPTQVVEKKFKVALVGTQKFGDQSVMDSMKKGVEDAGKDFNVEYKIIESLDPALYEEDVRALANEGYDMIIGSWFEMGKPLYNVAKDFPNIDFVNIYQVPFEKPLPNLRSHMTEYHYATFLGGLMAGKMTETGKVGFIGGANIPSIVADYNAFVQGVHLVNPKVETSVIYPGSFEDPAKGKESALTLYNNGADVIAYDASKTTLGGLEAAKETGKFMVADSPPQLTQAPANAFASQIINFNLMTYKAIQDLVQGTFKGGHLVSNINDGVIDITDMSVFQKNGPAAMTAKVDETWKFVQDTKQKIVSGELKVIYDEKEDAKY